jgi:peptidoglycan-associated lipoprotein
MIPIAILLAALPIPGQVPSRTSGTAPLEVTLAYSAMRFNTIPGGCGCSWMPGAKAEFRAAFSRHIGLVGEIAGQHAGAIDSAHQDLSLVSYLFGPRLSWPAHRFTPFVQGLMGGVHGFDATFLAAGGGLNISLSRYLALRPLQADYFLTTLPNNAANRQNSFRLGAGIVFKLSPPR